MIVLLLGLAFGAVGLFVVLPLNSWAAIIAYAGIGFVLVKLVREHDRRI